MDDAIRYARAYARWQTGERSRAPLGYNYGVDYPTAKAVRDLIDDVIDLSGGKACFERDDVRRTERTPARLRAIRAAYEQRGLAAV